MTTLDTTGVLECLEHQIECRKADNLKSVRALANAASQLLLAGIARDVSVTTIRDANWLALYTDKADALGSLFARTRRLMDAGDDKSAGRTLRNIAQIG